MGHESTMGRLDANSKHFEHSLRLREKRRDEEFLADEEEKRRREEEEVKVSEGWELMIEGMTPEERRYFLEQERLENENRDNMWDWDKVTEGYLTMEEQLQTREAQEEFARETETILAEERSRRAFRRDACRNGRRRTGHTRVMATGGNTDGFHYPVDPRYL